MRNATSTLLLITSVLGWTAIGSAQTPASGESKAASIEVQPSQLRVDVGSKAQLTAVVKDASGNPLPQAQIVFFSGSRAVGVTPSGLVEAYRPGKHTVVALSPLNPFEGDPDSYSRNDPGLRVEIEVTVPVPPLATLEILGVPGEMYAGTTLPVRVQGTDVSGATRGDVRPVLTVSDSTIAATDGMGEITAIHPGRVTLTASADEVQTRWELTVEPNPIASVELGASRSEARTGDVVHFQAIARDGEGHEIEDAPIAYLLQNRPDPSHADSVGAGAPAQVTEDGRFVAEQPGIYTIVAAAGGQTARKSVRITPRSVRQKIEVVGHAPVSDRVTADLWVWEGVDGRDYAVHGTWNAEGHAYFYDVTDPSDMKLIDKVQVDARTVNDVKVSEDGRICVISREGASNRRNGIVILDVSDPRDVKVLSQFDEQLTGGVHNVFLYENHVYAVNNGRRWDVINVEDARQPVRVARFETSTPGHSVHDVWVRDGIVYQAGRTDGVILVDVGGGGRGGSPSNPVEIARMPQLTGWNHSVWPFRSKSTGKFYVAGGDEAFWDNPLAPGVAISWEEKIPSYAEGWIHFIEFDDVSHPREVARYRVPESGPHNYWIDWEQEIMYVAHFDAGLRVVDLSGELLGDLYRQGREIAKFYSDDPQGFIPNAPFAWGPQPHKGTIFFSDLYSGLWAVRLVPAEESDEATEGGSMSPSGSPNP